MHWFRYILQILKPDILEHHIDFAANLSVGVIGDANAARLGDALQPCCDVDAVSKDVVFVDDYIADVDSDPELDPGFRRSAGILSDHLPLDFDSAARGIDGTPEFNENAIAGTLHDAAPVRRDCRLDKRLSKGLELRNGALLIKANQPTIAGDVCGEHGGQCSFHTFVGQRGPLIGEIKILSIRWTAHGYNVLDALSSNKREPAPMVSGGSSCAGRFRFRHQLAARKQSG